MPDARMRKGDPGVYPKRPFNCNAEDCLEDVLSNAALDALRLDFPYG